MKDLVKISYLIDCYGKLLTEKQLQYLIDYYFNDYSLNEIAENNNISKNAVYDSIKKSELELEKYEQVLKMVENTLKRFELYDKLNDETLKEKFLQTEVLDYGK